MSRTRNVGSRLGIFIFILVVVCGCRAPVTIYYNAPALIPGTRPEMNTAGFWIGRHPDPDALIMDQEDILWFNVSVSSKTGAVQDILRFPAGRDGQALKSSFRKILQYVSSQGYVTQNGTKAAKGVLPTMEASIGFERMLPRVEVQWGLVVNTCDQRLLPTSQPLYKSAADTSIDRLQNNTLDMATPVAILHTSNDHAWHYVISPFSDGWVEAKNVASCTRDEIVDFVVSPSFVVITEAKADLFLDPMLRRHHAYLYMGVRLPVFEESGATGVVQVRVPFRTKEGGCVFKEAYVSQAQISEGYLSYTPRHAIQQSFKLLHAPYGWGGMYGEQDCSRFIQEVFATMGIVLPRNSSQQAKVGRLLASFGKKNTASDRLGKLSGAASGGITLLQFPGHIMLYLGIADGTAYAIHDIFAYTEPATKGERLMAINRVAVTTLKLGAGTKKGSLLERLAMVRIMAPE